MGSPGLRHCFRAEDFQRLVLWRGPHRARLSNADWYLVSLLCGCRVKLTMNGDIIRLPATRSIWRLSGENRLKPVGNQSGDPINTLTEELQPGSTATGDALFLVGPGTRPGRVEYLLCECSFPDLPPLNIDPADRSLDRRDSRTPERPERRSEDATPHPGASGKGLPRIG